jgi:endonuclease/exonuclease/phosphatase family metal-dependent hydrolase
MEVTARAAAVISGWRGRVATRDPGTGTFWAAEGGFPPPDLIVGDFNIPRGSASLRNLTADFVNAYSQGGFGPSGTWPRRWPLVHIDQAFVGSSLRAARYRVIDPGAGGHRMQIIDLRARP